jgi:hypothetical protein
MNYWNRLLHSVIPMRLCLCTNYYAVSIHDEYLIIYARDVYDTTILQGHIPYADILVEQEHYFHKSNSEEVE